MNAPLPKFTTACLLDDSPPHRLQTSNRLNTARNSHQQVDSTQPVGASTQQVGASTHPTSTYALKMSPHEVEFTLMPDRPSNTWTAAMPNRPSSRVTAVVNAVATATQSKSVRASNKLSHKALADVLMRERHDNSEFRCRQCDNQAKCFIDTVCHFFEAGRDKNIAEERLDLARAAYEFYIEQLDGLVKQHWVMNRATCSKCGLEREPRN